MNRNDKWLSDVGNYLDEFTLDQTSSASLSHEPKLKKLFVTSLIAGLIMFLGYGFLIGYAVATTTQGYTPYAEKILIVSLFLVVFGLAMNLYNFGHILFTN